MLLVPLLRAGDGRRRRGEPRRVRPPRPRRRGGAGRRRLEPRAGRGPRALPRLRRRGDRAPGRPGARHGSAGRALAGPVPRRGADPARQDHPDWLVGEAGLNWGQDLRGLDLTHPGVQDLLRTHLERLVGLGVDYLKLDFLYGGAVPGARHSGASPVEAYRTGLELVREAVGPDVYLVGCGAPLLPSVGLVDAMRTSPDTFHAGGEDGSRGLRGLMPMVARAWQHGRLWSTDPDCLVARPAYALREPWAEAVRTYGGLRSVSDRVAELDAGACGRPATCWPTASRRRRCPPRPWSRARGWPPAWSPGSRTAPRERPRGPARPAGRPASTRTRPTRSPPRCSRSPSATRTGSARRTARPLDQRTAVLITYGDTVSRAGEAPLATLRELLDERVGDVVTDVHLLPMYPWTSDDGFGVVDHRRVDPALGTWDDVERLAERRTLWFDFVANHTSSSSPWFRGWLAGEAERAGFYLAQDPTSTSPASSGRGPRRCSPRSRGRTGPSVEAWTTFGPDQVDVDVRTPAVLLELTDVLLGYVGHGAGAVRLDAIGFLWKESGTTCLHLPQTHAVIQVWRALLDALAPGALLLTETNVPHAENVSYFGDGSDEANLVYQFALPPLVLHAFVSGSAARLRDWAAGIGPVSADGDLVQLPGQPRRHRPAPDRGHPRRRRARCPRRPGARPRRARRAVAAARRQREGLRAQPHLPRRPLHAGRGGGPGRARGQGPRGAQHPAHGRRGAGDLRALAARHAAGPGGDGRERDQPAREPGGARRRRPGGRAGHRPAAAGDVRGAAGPARRPPRPARPRAVGDAGDARPRRPRVRRASPRRGADPGVRDERDRRARPPPRRSPAWTC